MPPFPITVPLKYIRVISEFPPYFSLPERLPTRNGHALKGNSPSSFSKSLCSQKHTNSSLIAFNAKNSELKAYPDNDDNDNDIEAMDAVLKLYSALKNNNSQQLSEILAEECRCVCNFLSVFHCLHGKEQVLKFFSYWIRIFGKNVEIVVKPTCQDGMFVGVEWKFESDEIHVPLGKGLCFHICLTYQGKTLIRNIEMFVESILFFDLRLKMMDTLTILMEKIGSFTFALSKSENKEEWIKYIMFALFSLTLFLFFLRLLPSKPYRN